MNRTAKQRATTLFSILLIAPSLWAGSRPPHTVQALEPQEFQALERLQQPDLLLRTAGASQAVQPLSEASLQTLRTLEAENRELQNLRAGDLNISNDDLVTALLVLGVILLIVVIV